MKLKPMEYQTPAIYEHQMFVEGVLCISGGDSLGFDSDNENYGGDPGEDDSIF